jgi:photosystem II stability/assembly factor-like uncharacterized protein
MRRLVSFRGDRFGRAGVTLLAVIPALVGATLALPAAASASAARDSAPGVVTAPQITLEAATCASDTNCFAVGQVQVNETPPDSTINDEIFETQNAGATWSADTAPSVTGDLTSISCPSATECFAGGGQALTGEPQDQIIETTDDGAEWSEVTLPDVTDSVDQITAIECTSDESCMATDGSGFVLATSNGGAAWTASSIPEKSGFGAYPSSVACVSSTTCFVGGYSESSSSDGRRIAGRLKFPPPPTFKDLFVETTDGGTSWTKVKGISGQIQDVNSISCPSSSDCFASADNEIGTPVALATVNGGSSWSVENLPDALTDSGGSSIACPATSICFEAQRGSVNGKETGAVDVTKNGGSSWKAEAVNQRSGLSGIGCASTTVCFATPDKVTKNTGVLWTTSDEGTTWTKITVPTPTD